MVLSYNLLLLLLFADIPARGYIANELPLNVRQLLQEGLLLGSVCLQTLTDKTLSRVSFNEIVNLNLQHKLNGASEITAEVSYGRFNREFDNNLNTLTLIPEGNPFCNGQVIYSNAHHNGIRSTRVTWANEGGKPSEIHRSAI